MKTTALIRNRIDALNTYFEINRDAEIETLFAAKDRIERLEGALELMCIKAREGRISSEDVTDAYRLLNAEE